jgi:hypothetical protein
MKTRTLLRLGLVLLLCGPLMAAEPEAWVWTPAQLTRVKQLKALIKKDGAFFVMDSPTWNVRSDVSEDFTAELAAFMEVFYQQLSDTLQIKAQPIPEKMKVTVFAAEDDYRKLFNNGTRGYFRWQFDASGKFTDFTLYSFVKEPAEREFAKFYHPILQHEGTHMLLQRFAGKNKIPPFINEGIATWFQFWNLRMTMADNLKKRKTQSFYHSLLLEKLKAEKDFTPKLDRMLQIEEKDWNRDNMGAEASLNYALGESFIEMLATDAQANGLLADMLGRVFKKKEAFAPAEIPRVNGLWTANIKK